VPAMNSIGSPLDQPALAQAVVLAYGNSTSPLDVADALIAGFNTAATTLSVTQELISAYENSFPPLYPGDNMLSVRLAFNIPTTEPGDLVPVTGDAYLLGGESNYIGALAVACAVAGFEFQPVVNVLSSYYGPAFSENGVEITLNAFNNPDWLTARDLQAQGGFDVTDTARILREFNPNILPADLVAILAATFNLVHSETSVEIMALAMRVAGFALPQTLAAMRSQYEPFWGRADNEAVARVFGRGQP